MGYLTANDRPGVHPRSWYAETAGPLPDLPRLEGETKADICVIGGGYAGLSTALHLAERRYSVVLLEANRVGWGASGRNGGQVGIGPRAAMNKYERAVGRANARAIWDIAIEANALVKSLIHKHKIDCDLKPGYLEAAWRASDARELADWVETAAERYDHTELRILSREEVADLLGTTRYHGGALDPLGAHLHPLRYALGLARAASGAGVRLYEGSRVRRMGTGRIETDRGSVVADQVVLACNGYIDGLDIAMSRRTMPINNFILATDPLKGAVWQRINPRDLCVCDTKFVLNYFRLSPDKRLLWGGGESYGRRFPRNMEAVVRRAIADIYPDLANVKASHVWGGTLAITPTRMPAFQRRGGRVWSISGWSGSGIHMATMGGMVLAEAISGTMERWDVLARCPTPAFPGGDWFRFPLLATAMSLAALRDRI